MYDILKSFDSLSTEEASTGNKRKATTGSMKALLESFDSIANETEEVAEEELQEGAMKRQLIHDMETMTKSEFAKKYGKEMAAEYYDESVEEAEVTEAVTDTVIFNAEEGGILVSVDGKPVGWASHPKELAQMLGKMGVDAKTPMFHSSDVDFASEEGFDSDDGAHEFIDAALGMIGLSESSCKRMEESKVDEGRMKQLYTELEELEPKIMRLKTAYMDKGVEPEEAQDMACEKLGCDPEMFDEYLTMKFDELDEAEVEENAFNQAAAAAARAGKDTFEFGGKTHKTTMDKDTAHKLDDDMQIEEMDASIIDHLKNGTSFDDEVDIEDKGEYDREGEMADDQLNTVHDAAQELQDIIDADDNLPEWVQSKITKAMDYLDTARDYMKSQLDEKAVSQAQQQAAGIALAAKRKGEKPKGKGAAAQMAKMSKKDLEDFAGTKHKGLPKKKEKSVKETTTSGSVAADSGESSKPNGMYGKGIYESDLEKRFAEKMSEQLTESVNISISQPDEGDPSVSISGTGVDAMKLSELLKLSGMFSSSGYDEVKVDEAELSNSADNTVTMDADYMTNDIAGGLNGPKQQVNPNNSGDNPLAMTDLGKDASPNLNLGAIAEQVEDEVKNHLVDLYKRIS